MEREMSLSQPMTYAIGDIHGESPIQSNTILAFR